MNLSFFNRFRYLLVCLFPLLSPFINAVALLPINPIRSIPLIRVPFARGRHTDRHA